MGLFGNDKEQNSQNQAGIESDALQSVLNDAEQALCSVPACPDTKINFLR